MPNRTNQVIAYLDDREYAQLKEWSEETGKSMSHLLREAILEYTDHDRTARLEEKVDRLLEDLDSGGHTHTSPTKHQSVPEKTRAIIQHLYEHHEPPIQDTDVEIAIENLAGGDDRTIRKYKEQFKKRDLLFEHPVQPLWTDDKEQWVEWVENATVGKDVYEWTEEYDMTTDEYTEIAERVVE